MPVIRLQPLLALLLLAVFALDPIWAESLATPPASQASAPETLDPEALETQPSIAPTLPGRLALTEEERAFLQAHPVIRVGNEPDWPPYDFFEQGKAQGYSVDLMRLLAARIGVELEFVQAESWDALVDLLCSRQIDLLQPADQPRKLRDCATFSAPIVRGSNQFLTRRDHPEVRSIQDLFGSVAASPKGWEQTERLKRDYGDKIRILETPDIAEAIAAVSQGRADFTTDFANVLNYHIASLGYVNLKAQGVWNWQDSEGEFSELYIATRNDMPLLQSIIDKAQASLTPDQIRRVQERWFGADSDRAGRVALSPQQILYLENKGPIRFCVDPDWMPLQAITRDGVYQGIMADIMAELATMLDVQLELVITESWQESLDAVRHGRCELLAAAAATPERRAFLDFTSPFLSFNAVIATQRQKPFIYDLESVLGETFGVTRGYAIIHILRARYPGIRLREVADITEGLNLVRDGQLYGFIDAMPTIAYRLQTQAIDDLKIGGILDDNTSASTKLSIATRREEPLLGEIFQVAVKALPPQEIQAIVNGWLTIRYERVFDAVLLWKIVAAVVTVAGFILWAVLAWNRRLKRLNRELSLARAQIAEQNLGLEQRVAERTRDLQETLARLEQAQASLVQSEKLAALGDLVAGIAHELNTPIGNAVMLASTLSDQERAFRDQMAAGLSRAALQRFVDAVREGSDVLLRSLRRAAELISSFKQVAVDQASYQRRRFSLEEVTREIALTLQPRLRHSPASLEVSVAPEITLDSYPGPLGQVLMNLIQNALLHAFEGRDSGQIRIESQLAAPGFVLLRVSDDGNGIAPANLSRIFDPFFTTRLGQGGSGLGLHIVYNLVTGLLGGAISVRSTPDQGTVFELALPLTAPQTAPGAAQPETAAQAPDASDPSAAVSHHSHPGASS
ncbi:MAG: transporter substrate-binding domain-containing protein [Chromatiaceae bacterium]|nr:transporter substrate-binding domain-containing protein [Chromatiaceae bacterium]